VGSCPIASHPRRELSLWRLTGPSGTAYNQIGTNCLSLPLPVMITDPEFSEIGKDKSKPKTVWRWVRPFLVYPVLGFSGCHMLLTGSPIPLWYTEPLDHPVRVKEVTDRTLVLANGRSVPLPFIKRLPVNDPVFLKALKHGVEIGQDGEAVGLLTVYPFCGNDPCRWRTMRINLSDLAGFMDADGIDDSIVPPDAIKLLKENESRSLDRHALPFDLMGRIRNVRSIYRAVKGTIEQQPNPTLSFSRQQIDP
jgi:hypothetical protein